MNKPIPCLIQVTTPLLIALLLLITAAHPAKSTPLVWTLNNAVFDDGVQAIGSFVYDDDTHTITSADITTTAGSSIPFDGPYDASMVDRRSTTSHLVFWDGYYTLDYTYTEWRQLDLILTQPLTNDGGEIPLALGQQNYDESVALGLYLIPPASCELCASRSFISGSIVAQPLVFADANARSMASVSQASTAPEPSTLALLSVALCGFGVWGRNRQSRRKAPLLSTSISGDRDNQIVTL